MFPSYISWVHHFGWAFCVHDPFLINNPTTEVVTFHLHGWCMLGVFLLLNAGIYPSRTWMSGSFESARWNACVHRLDRSYSHPNEFLGNGVRTYLNSKGKILSIWKILPRGVSNPQPRATQDRELNTLPMSYSCPEGIPHNCYILWWVTLSSRKCNHISLIAQKSMTHFLHPTCLLTHLKTSFVWSSGQKPHECLLDK